MHAAIGHCARRAKPLEAKLWIATPPRLSAGFVDPNSKQVRNSSSANENETNELARRPHLAAHASRRGCHRSRRRRRRHSRRRDRSTRVVAAVSPPRDAVAAKCPAVGRKYQPVEMRRRGACRRSTHSRATTGTRCRAPTTRTQAHAIVGAGFAGVATAYHVFRQADAHAEATADGKTVAPVRVTPTTRARRRRLRWPRACCTCTRLAARSSGVARRASPRCPSWSRQRRTPSA